MLTAPTRHHEFASLPTVGARGREPSACGSDRIRLQVVRQFRRPLRREGGLHGWDGNNVRSTPYFGAN